MLKKVFGSSLFASMFLTGVAAAQTATSSPTTTPGIPNTGAGEVVINVMILAVSAIIAIGGALYLYSTRNA